MKRQVNEEKNTGIPSSETKPTPELSAAPSFGRHLSNIFDHRKPNAEMYLTYSHHAYANGPSAMKMEWQRHLDWIKANIIGPPKATDHYTVEQLEAMNMIGLYAPLAGTQETSTDASSGTT